MDTTEYRAFIERRKVEIEARLREAVPKAANEVFEDEQIAAKALIPEAKAVRLNFRDGLGYEIKIELHHEPEYERLTCPTHTFVSRDVCGCPPERESWY